MSLLLLFASLSLLYCADGTGSGHIVSENVDDSNADDEDDDIDMLEVMEDWAELVDMGITMDPSSVSSQGKSEHRKQRVRSAEESELIKQLALQIMNQTGDRRNPSPSQLILLFIEVFLCLSMLSVFLAFALIHGRTVWIRVFSPCWRWWYLLQLTSPGDSIQVNSEQVPKDSLCPICIDPLSLSSSSDSARNRRRGRGNHLAPPLVDRWGEEVGDVESYGSLQRKLSGCSDVSEEGRNAKSSKLLLLPCGHLLHHACGMGWFEFSIDRFGMAEGRQNENTFMWCPTCRGQMARGLADCLEVKVDPSFDGTLPSAARFV